MDKEKVDVYLLTHGKYFEAQAIPYIRQKLLSLSEDEFYKLQLVEYKDPTMLLVVSVLVGSLGIDRFLVGDIGLGIGKLITLGGCGIWAIIDWFLIMGRTRQVNFQKLNSVMTW